MKRPDYRNTKAAALGPSSNSCPIAQGASIKTPPRARVLCLFLNSLHVYFHPSKSEILKQRHLGTSNMSHYLLVTTVADADGLSPRYSTELSGGHRPLPDQPPVISSPPDPTTMGAGPLVQIRGVTPNESQKFRRLAAVAAFSALSVSFIRGMTLFLSPKGNPVNSTPLSA